ncbi:MAG: hypothetical protein OEV31_02060, partial [Gammaproteobacteria bacterium]|nr:hypothetical protein [Gammaproteobacteria bacterium]
MNKKILTGVLGAGLLGGLSLPASGASTDNITFSGFLTAGANYASQPVLANTGAVSSDGSIGNVVSFEKDSRFGLQVSAQINPEVSVTGQMLAKANENSYSLSTDWAYVKYRASNNLSVRAGRVKLPSFLISDYNEVGYAYPWVRPPQEMYSANPMTGVNGVDMLLRFNMGDLGLLIQPFYGNNTQETTVPQAVATTFPLCG